MMDDYRSTFDEFGKFHSVDDQPACIDEANDIAWFKHGTRHRENGPAFFSSDGKRIMWFLEGHLHRTDGPAYCVTDDKGNHCEEWYIQGLLHRLDGPAVCEIGITSWYMYGIDITGEILDWAKIMNMDLERLTDDDKRMILVTWPPKCERERKRLYG